MQIKNILIALCVLCSISGFGQFSPLEPDKSPMDMSYCPNNYPIAKFQEKTAPAIPYARVVYSRPQKNGRAVFGGIVKYNEMWRLGANESTEIDLYKDATIGGKKLSKGRYTLYCIPAENNWTIVLNKGLDTWGAFSYNKDLDVLRTTVPVEKIETNVEYFTMVFDTSNALNILWENVRVRLPIKFVTK